MSASVSVLAGEVYYPEWGVKLTQAGASFTISAIGKAPDAISALRAILDANGHLDPSTFEKVEVFRVRHIGGPEL